MREKNYPRVVVLRKGLMGVIVAVALLLTGLILYNLLHGLHPRSATQEHHDIQMLASDADTQWYKNETAREPLVKASAAISPQHKPSAQSDETINEVRVEHTNQEFQRAMSAPISSNQINADPPNRALGFANASNESPISVNDDTLQSTLKASSRYVLQAGMIIPGILMTGINSDLPGQITAIVRSNVYDSVSGRYLLVPQGARLIGWYDAQISYGQKRLLISWKRILFPNGQSIDLQGMPGVDLSGYAGFQDRVNNHYAKLFGSVVLMSVLSAGAQLAQPQSDDDSLTAPTIGQTLAQSVGTNLIDTGAALTSKALTLNPTLEIRPGYKFNIAVTKDIVFSKPYRATNVP